MSKTLALLLFPALALAAQAPSEPDWSRATPVPETGRANLYQLDEAALPQVVQAGKSHALHYPVEITAALIPERPLENLFTASFENPLVTLLAGLVREFSSYRSVNQVFAHLGMHEYPNDTDRGVYSVPYPEGGRPNTLMGYTVIESHGARGVTFSCALCHSGNLFGKKVLGLSNRFARANEAFVKGKEVTAVLPTFLFRVGTDATDPEVEMYGGLQVATAQVQAKLPLVLGLDTSLAQVALSMARREADGVGSPSKWHEIFPRADRLDDEPADSKPAVWWNVKYKNRWLADGSVVSGNPILTNLIWNEIGRGTDLQALDEWLDRNGSKIEELGAAVFASEAPRFTDFFPAERIPLDRARRGERIFNVHCASCHGTYEKAWNRADAATLSPEQKLETTVVRYHDQTPVADVGTDSYRRLGMTSVAKALNGLALSKKHGILIAPQPGYVPPPLVGIWARWPYFHNNSVPSLCGVLTRHEERPATYYSGEALDPRRDFDETCNGYPLGDATPSPWKTDEHFYDTSRKGLSNSGHDEGIFLRGGREVLSSEDKMDLVRFLQTL